MIGKNAVALAAVVCVALGSFVLSLAQAQDGARDADALPVDEVHLGAGSCAAQACHGGGFETRMEYKVWASKDPHSNAYSTLGSPLGKRIGERLGIDVTRSERCLNCHGTVGVETAETFDQTDGVSCELCHGGAKHWLGPHVDEEWRQAPPETKAKLGLRDLTTARKRAKLCVTCHVGAPGREIGHDIMAAGHPPLVFDAAKQMRDMHPHWTDERDMSLLLWAEGLRTGAVAELRRLSRAARDKRNWMEFAVFDCYSCHHPIYQGTAYEKRKLLGKPGDLPLDLATLRVLVRVTGDRALAESFAAILRRTVAPNEDPRTVAAEAEKAAKLLEGKHLGAVELDREPRALADRWLAILRAWVASPEVTSVPPHVMHQLALAIDVLVPNRMADGYRDAYAALLRSVDPKRPYDAAASAKLALRAIDVAAR